MTNNRNGSGEDRFVPATPTGRLMSLTPNTQGLPLNTPEARRLREAFAAEYRDVHVMYETPPCQDFAPRFVFATLTAGPRGSMGEETPRSPDA